MARKSTSSSTVHSNGHPQPPANGDGVPPKRPVPESNREDTSDEFDWDSPQYSTKNKPLPYDRSLLPNGSRSLSSIGIQAFSLGFVLAFCVMSTALLAREGKTIWRLPAFFACLSLFHFLEYWTTARFNMPATRASSFLLNNGMAYSVAHILAAVEIVVSSFVTSYQSLLVQPYTISTGAVLVVVGQLVRSLAMAEAGTNFNHTPAKTKKEGHVLVITGIYAWLRHPSYFAFFWWALGTQILVGNKICALGFLFALWTFFKRRIRGEFELHRNQAHTTADTRIAEEITLVQFFANDYEEYRARTGTGIPFIP